jgi:hypothetical protein
MNNEKIKPGDVLFDGQLNEYPVVKVGTKFVYVKAEYREQKIELCNLSYINYIGGTKFIQLYRSKQEALDSTQADKLFDLICKRISQYYSYKSANITPTQLRQIAEVLGIE